MRLEQKTPSKDPLCLGHGVVLCAPTLRHQRLTAVHDEDEHHRDHQSVALAPPFTYDHYITRQSAYCLEPC